MKSGLLVSNSVTSPSPQIAISGLFFCPPFPRLDWLAARLVVALLSARELGNRVTRLTFTGHQYENGLLFHSAGRLCLW